MKAKEDVSNKIVFVLAIMVILIVFCSSFLVYTKLSKFEGKSNFEDFKVQKLVEQHPPSGGAVGLTILSNSIKGGEQDNGFIK